MTKNKLITLDAPDDSDRIMQMIRDIAGEEAYDLVCRHFGGTRLHIPSLSRFNEKSLLSRRLGHDMAKKVMDAVGVEVWQRVTVPRGKYGVVDKLIARVTELLAEDGFSSRDIALMTGAHMRTVYRRRAEMLARGEKIGNWKAPRRNEGTADVKGANIVRQLLMEGHAPSLLRDIMKIPPDVILTIRAELLRQGKLK